MGTIANKAAELAVVEWRDKWKRGGGDEDDPIFKKFVAIYWDKLGPGFNNWENTEQPWSAAFISYVFSEASASKSQFPFSAAHHVYIRKGDDNFKAGKLNASLVAFLVDEARPEVGDLIVYWRETKRRLRALPSGGFKSHTDIVVSKTASEVITIGGNLSDSVLRRSRQLDEDGHLVKTDDMMGFLRVNF